jgi:hypothetical protein
LAALRCSPKTAAATGLCERRDSELTERATLWAGARRPVGRDRGRTMLDDDLAIAEEDGAGAALSLAEASAQLGNVGIRVDHVPFDRLHARLVVSTVVESYPKTLELRRSTDQRPGDPIRHFRFDDPWLQRGQPEGMDTWGKRVARSTKDLGASALARQATGLDWPSGSIKNRANYLNYLPLH